VKLSGIANAIAESQAASQRRFTARSYDQQQEAYQEAIRAAKSALEPTLNDQDQRITELEQAVMLLATALSKVAQVPGMVYDQEITAGGPVSQAQQKGVAKAGVPWATGMLVLSTQEQVPGFIKCVGQELDAGAFPQLAEVLRDSDLVSNTGNPDQVTLPTAAQINTAITNGTFYWLMRY
jgi:hypothetical protein